MVGGIKYITWDPSERPITVVASSHGSSAHLIWLRLCRCNYHIYSQSRTIFTRIDW